MFAIYNLNIFYLSSMVVTYMFLQYVGRCFGGDLDPLEADTAAGYKRLWRYVACLLDRGFIGLYDLGHNVISYTTGQIEEDV